MRLFKHYFLLFILSFSALYAQEGFYYQAVIKNPDGSPLKESQVEVKISIVTNTSILYTEQRSIQTSREGFVSFIIGESDPSSFSNINWGQDLFLEDQIDINDGEGFSTPSRMPILKSPRAYVADRAVNIYSKDGTLVLNSGDSGTKPTFTGNLLDSSGGTIIDNTAGSVALTGDLTGNVTGTVSSLANQNTDALTEGSINLYFTDARAQGAITAGTGITVTSGEVAIGQAVGTADDVSFNSVTAALTGNLYASNGTSVVLDSGTDGTDATFTGDVTGNLSGNAATATALETARTIGGVSFDGTANIDLPGVNTAGNQNTSGNAATTTITDNDSTDENNAIVFTPDGDQNGGNLGLESDKDLTYNPSTGTLSAAAFSGILSGAVNDTTEDVDFGDSEANVTINAFSGSFLISRNEHFNTSGEKTISNTFVNTGSIIMLTEGPLDGTGTTTPSELKVKNIAAGEFTVDTGGALPDAGSSFKIFFLIIN